MTARASRKARKTFTLDSELVAYLEAFRARHKMASSSSALEEIIRESQCRREQREQDDRIAAYYSGLDPVSAAEDAAWGHFAETQFPVE